MRRRRQRSLSFFTMRAVPLVMIAILLLNYFVALTPRATGVSYDLYHYMASIQHASIPTPADTITWKAGQGSGTAEDPYTVTSWQDFVDFIELRRNATKNDGTLKGLYFVQTADIDFPENGTPITPLTGDNGFRGSYDGNGHVIRNIEISYTGSKASGLFGRLYGEIRNLGFEGGTFTVVTSADCAGSLVTNIDGTGYLYNVYSTIDIDATSSGSVFYPGGIAGYASGAMENVYYGGAINVTDIYTGGATIKTFGLARTPDSASSTTNLKIYSSFTLESVANNINYNFQNRDGTFEFNNEQKNTAPTAFYSAEEIIYRMNLFLLNDRYLNPTKASTFTWTMGGDNAHPVLTSTQTTIEDYLEGNGSAATPYLIDNEADWSFLRLYILANANNQTPATLTGKYFKQTADINFSLNNIEYGSMPFAVKFSGIYDGDGHALTNLKLVGGNGAIFGDVKGTVKNLAIVGGSFQNTDGAYAATIARALSDGGEIINCYSSMSMNNGSTSRTRPLVGIVAAVETTGGTIKNTYYAGSMDTYTCSGNVVAGCTDRYGISYNLSSATLENVYYLSTSADEPYYASTNPTITNVKSVTSEELSGADLLAELNTLAEADQSLKVWELREGAGYEYPVFEGQGIAYGVINSLTVDGDDLQSTADQINWYLDSTSGEYYLFLPNFVDRSSLNLILDNTAGSTVQASLPDTTVLSNDLQSGPTDIFENDQVILKTLVNNAETSSYVVNVMQSTIASVHLTIDGTNAEDPAQSISAEAAFALINGSPNHSVAYPGAMTTYDTSKTKNTVSMKEIKGRGNSSWNKPKKPYQMKFANKLSMFGMTPSKKWLLITNHMDGSLARNFTFFTMAEHLNFEYQIEHTPADLYVNNNYIGSYWVTNKVEVASNSVNIGDEDYLLELDNYKDNSGEDIQVETANGALITIKNPDLEDADAATISAVKADVKQQIEHLETIFADDSLTLADLEEYADMESFAKFYWVQELSANVDAMRGSAYLYYKDGKFHMGPIWDYDYVLNRHYSWSNLQEYFILGNATQRAKTYFEDWYDGLMRKQEFSDLVDKVFLENRDYLVTTLPSEITAYTNLIYSSGKMNEVRWPYSAQGSATYVGSNYEDGVAKLLAAYNKRLAWYDNEYRDLNLAKVQYTYTDLSGTDHVETQNISGDSIAITLPNTTDVAEPVTVVGVLPNDTTRSIRLVSGETSSTGEVTLANRAYTGDLRVENTIGVQIDKTVNANKYSLAITATAPVLTSIEVTTPPTKTTYYEGESFDKTGMVVTAHYDNNVSEAVEDYTVDTAALAANATEVTVTYNDKTTAVPITMVALESIEVTTQPTKTVYLEGESFDKTGMVVTAHYDNSDTETVEDYTFEDAALAAGTTSVTISYGGKTTTTPITVRELESISVTTQPTKTVYNEGEHFDKTGMVVTAHYDNNDTETVEDFTFEDTALAAGTTSVTISYGGKNATTPITVRVLESISVTTQPTKTVYTEGEHFDKTGMVVTAHYDNNDTETVEDFTFEDTAIAAGTTSVTISYGGKNTTTPITVRVLESISVTTQPTKTVYTEGEHFDKTGMVVTAHYDNNDDVVVEDYTFDDVALAAGTTAVTISYGGKNVDVPITVNLEVISLEVSQLPNKVIYTEGEHFDKTGMVITAHYSDGSTGTVDDYTFENTALAVGTNKVTITYGSKTVDVPIIVNEAEQEPDPEPEPTPTPTPTPTPQTVIIYQTAKTTSKPAEPTVKTPTATGIFVDTLPTKTTYYEGESFDKTGMVVKVAYDDGTAKEIETYKFSDTALISSTEEIILTFGEFTTEVPITVKKITYGFVGDSEIEFNGNDVVLRAGGPADFFKELFVDGSLVSKDSYTVRGTEDGLVITLDKDYLNNLGDGIHEVKAVYTNGRSITTSIKIAKASNIPLIVLAIIAVVMTILAALSFAMMRNKKREV